MNTSKILLVFVLPVILFTLIHTALTITANSLSSSANISRTISADYFSYLVVGYLSGVFSTSRHLFNGLIVGAISGLVAILLFGVGGIENYQTKLVLCVTSATLGGLGAVLSKFRMVGKKDD